MHPREMVRIWIAFLHQEKPVHFVYWFFFFGAKEDLKKAAAHCAASKAPVGLCLACGSQPVGTSTGRTAADFVSPDNFPLVAAADYIGTGVEDALDVTMAQRSELDYLIYNDPLGYADLLLNGDPEEYLRNGTGSHGLED